MASAAFLDVWPLWLTALVLIALKVAAWPRRTARGGRVFMAMIWFALAWCVGCGAEAVADSLAAKLMWVRVEYVGYMGAPFCFLLLVLQLDRRSRWLSGPRLLLLALVPALTVGLFWTNDLHHLVWQSYSLDLSLPARYLGPVAGPWYWVDVGYSLMEMIVALAILWHRYRREQGVRRRQALLMLAALVPPTLSVPAYLAGAYHALRLSYDPTAVSMMFTVPLLAWGLFRHRLFALVPVARDRVIEEMSDGVIVVSDSGELVDLNPAAERTFNLVKSKAVESLVQDVFAGWPGLVQLCSSTVPSRIETAVATAERAVHYEARVTPLIGRRGRLVGRVVVLRDISERKTNEDRLAAMAAQDPLTGLLNRRSFEEAAQRVLASSSLVPARAAVLFLDLDHFKVINDRLGHAAGDEILVSLSSLLRSHLRENDLIARLGGDEFTIFLAGTGLDEAVLTAERLRQAVGEYDFHLGATHFDLTLSIGVAAVQGVDDLSSALARADSALYEAKSLGRDRVAASSCPSSGRHMGDTLSKPSYLSPT